jgi:ABC-type multidrug transport system fused ATPase/permease subunit
MMKELLQIVARKDYDADTEFPYGLIVILILSPFIAALFETWSIRFFFHFSARVKTVHSAMVYNKTLLLNLSTQSNVDTGRLLSLLTTDTMNLASMIWQPFSLMLFPVQLLIPFVFVVIDFHAVGLVPLAVLFVAFIVQSFLAGGIGRHFERYLTHNDERNKVTNETLQGIRVVKCTGLEDVFMGRINKAREQQLTDLF